MHFALRRHYEASATHLVNAYLQSYEYVLFEKARNGDTAADLAKKAGLKALEISIRKKMVSLSLHINSSSIVLLFVLIGSTETL